MVNEVTFVGFRRAIAPPGSTPGPLATIVVPLSTFRKSLESKVYPDVDFYILKPEITAKRLKNAKNNYLLKTKRAQEIQAKCGISYTSTVKDRIP